MLEGTNSPNARSTARSHLFSAELGPNAPSSWTCHMVAQNATGRGAATWRGDADCVSGGSNRPSSEGLAAPQSAAADQVKDQLASRYHGSALRRHA